MADNITLNLGSGGSALAADEVSSAYYQRIKVAHGADGSATDVSSTSGFPVDMGYTVAGKTPAFQAVTLAASGNLVAAGTNRIRLLALAVYGASDGATTLVLNDGSGGTALSGTFLLSDPEGLVLPFNPVGWCQTTAATALYATLGGTADLDGFAVYIDVA